MNNNYNNFENQFSNDNNAVNNNVGPQQPIQEPIQQPVYQSQNIENKSNKGGRGKLIISIVAAIIVMGVALFLTKNVFSSESANGGNKFGGSKTIEKVKGTTYKGTVYLDPTNLDKSCTKEEALANLNENGTPTEVKTGCMRFYIYDDSGSNYKMILDHNTTGAVQWKNAEKRLKEDTKGWEGNPRLISANEIAHIAGADKEETLSWKADNDTHVCYELGGSGNSVKTWTDVSPTDKSKYAWLFDYTSGCKENGCSVEDNYKYYAEEYEILDATSINRSYGYWASEEFSYIGSFEDLSWQVRDTGMVCYVRQNLGHMYGVRPVLEIPKDKIK